MEDPEKQQRTWINGLFKVKWGLPNVRNKEIEKDEKNAEWNSGSVEAHGKFAAAKQSEQFRGLLEIMLSCSEKYLALFDTW